MKKMVLIFIVAGLVVIGSCSDDIVSTTEVGRILGSVYDSNTDKPLSGVTITTTPATYAVITDETGEYLIDEAIPGSYVIRASKEGYNNAFVNVTIIGGKTVTADIAMLVKTSSNLPPVTPTLLSPSNGSEDHGGSLLLSWQCSDPNSNDSIEYDLYFGSTGDLPLSTIVSGTADTTYTVSGLTYDTTYFWQVVARDSEGETTHGPVWNFHTGAVPENDIVFASDRDGTYAIYSISPQGEYLAQLTHSSSRDWNPKYSPDGSLIAFVSDRNIKPQIYIMDTAGKNLLQTTSQSVDSYHNYGTGFSWSPEGTYLYYGHYDELCRINRDGTGLTNIATAPEGKHFSACDVSPYGNRIVTVVQGTSYYDNKLYMMNVDGTNMELLVDDLPGKLGHPTFSPDGLSIVYYYDVAGFEDPFGERMLDARLFSYNIASGYTTEITRGKESGTNDIDPSWSSDGSKIVFTNMSNTGMGTPSIYVIKYFPDSTSSSSTGRVLVTDNGMMPDWR